MCLCPNRFFTRNRDEDFLNFLPIRTLHDGTVHLYALFFISVLSGLKCCPSLLDTIVIRVLPSNFRNFCYLVLHVKTLRLLRVFQLLAMCAKMTITLGTPLLH
jgi:hypothetical protein